MKIKKEYMINKVFKNIMNKKNIKQIKKKIK